MPIGVQTAAVFAVAFLTSRLLTPVAMVLAEKVGAVDRPGGRKVHGRDTPRIGGVAIALATAVAMTPGLFVPSVFQAVGRNLELLAALVWGGGMIFLLGVFDDVRGTNAPWKFFVQGVAAAVTYSLGFKFTVIADPFGGTIELGVLALPITLVWIVGVTNAMNLIDGLDGLAAGLSLIICASVGAIALLRGDIVSLIVCAALAGSLSGFLRYNWNPARIFMGDSGSMFIGFLLAVLSLRSSSKGPTAVAVVVPILALGVPVIDTLLVMWLRFRDGESVSIFDRVLRMFRADRNHIHHLLLERFGGGHRGAVVVIYALATLFAMGALSVAVSNSVTQGFVLIVLGTVAVLLVRMLASRFRREEVEPARESADALGGEVVLETSNVRPFRQAQ